MVEYKLLSGELYEQMVETIKEQTTSFLFKVIIRNHEDEEMPVRDGQENVEYTSADENGVERVEAGEETTGDLNPDSPCSCGSGKNIKTVVAEYKEASNEKIVAGLFAVALLVSCSSLDKGASLEQKYSITKESAKEWDKTISQVIEGEALIDEWYGNENPIVYLRKTGKMSEKDFNFLTSLEKKDATAITDEEYEEFVDLVNKYNKKLPRKFYLADENLKNPKGLVDRMVRETFVKMDNPSNHIKNVVATQEEWEQIVAFSQQDDLSEKDTKQLRKLLNKFIKRDEFYDERAWYNREISDRVIEITNIDAKENTTALEQNNVNAKALYIAYPEYFQL